MLSKMFKRLFPDASKKHKEALAEKSLNAMMEMVENKQYEALSEFIASKKSDAIFSILSGSEKDKSYRDIIFRLIDLMVENDGQVLLQFLKKNLEAANKKTMDFISLMTFSGFVIRNNVPYLEKISQDFPDLFMGTDKTQSIIFASNDMAIRMAFGVGALEAIEFIECKNSNKKIDYKGHNHACLKFACKYGHENMISFLINRKMLYSAEEIEQIDFERISYGSITQKLESPKIGKSHVLKLIHDRDETEKLKNLVTQERPSSESSITQKTKRKTI